MNKDKRLLLICIVVILGLIGCNIYLQYENDKLTKEKDNVKEEKVVLYKYKTLDMEQIKKIK